MKEKILEKATEMFLNLGFKSVTMDDLANEMGISKKTIYTHFENKTKLIEQCVIRITNKITNGINGICDLNSNPIEELYEIKKFVMLNLKNEKTSPQYQVQKYYPKIYKTVKMQQFDTMQHCVQRNIQRGMDDGFYRNNLNTEFVSRIYYSGMMSLKNHTLFPIENFPVADLMDAYLEYHLRGIVTPKGRKVLNTIINSNLE